MSEWIKCSDRMPRVGVPVLLVGREVVQFSAYRLQGIGFACRDGYQWVTCDDLEADPVSETEPTHWQYLPAPPEAS